MIKISVLIALLVSMTAAANTATLEHGQFQEQRVGQFKGGLGSWMKKASKWVSNIAEEASETPLLAVAKQVSGLAPIYRPGSNKNLPRHLRRSKWLRRKIFAVTAGAPWPMR